MKAILAAFAALLLVANVEAGCRRNVASVTFVPANTFIAVPNNVVLLGGSTIVLNNGGGASASASSGNGAAAASSSGGSAAASSGFGRRGVSKAFSFTGPFGGNFSRSVSR